MNIVAAILIIVSFGLLFPGVTQPVFTMEGSVEISKFIPGIPGSFDLGKDTKSIWGTTKYLYETKNYLVSSLIFIFSITVPVVKGLCLLVVLLPGHKNWKPWLLAFIRRIGKWSMADVFVMAVLLAFLSTASMDIFKGHLEKGFYFFLGYCLISVLSTEFILLRAQIPQQKTLKTEG